MFSATSLVHARLSLKQILLILSYVLLESSLLPSIGNIGQIQDLLAREGKDWDPHIGRETYPDMIQRDWSEASRETRRAWKEIRQYMVHQNLVDSTISSSDIREMLGRLLFQIELVSTQGLNAVRNRKMVLDMPGFPFSERGILALICMSVSVTTTPGGSVSLRALLADPDQEVMREMCSRLPRSPLFRNGVSLFELQEALKSLDELFLFLSGFSKIIDEESNIENVECVKTPPMATTRRETWRLVHETQEAESPIRGQCSGSRPTQAAVIRRSTRGISKLPKRRKWRSLGPARNSEKQSSTDDSVLDIKLETLI